MICLSWADIITIHVSVKDRLVGEKEFQLMKKGAWLVNTSRGGVVDEKVLYEHLKMATLLVQLWMYLKRNLMLDQ